MGQRVVVSAAAVWMWWRASNSSSDADRQGGGSGAQRQRQQQQQQQRFCTPVGSACVEETSLREQSANIVCLPLSLILVRT
jgi:hypothetical protein